jgi:hypothetical protein
MKGFNALDIFFKVNFIIENGKHVLNTNYGNYAVDLFSWDRFFFELYRDRNMTTVTRASQASPRDMVKYLNKISLADLGVRTMT